MNENNLKVNKSQKKRFLKLHCPKSERNSCENYALASSGRILSNISLVFWAIEFQKSFENCKSRNEEFGNIIQGPSYYLSPEIYPEIKRKGRQFPKTKISNLPESAINVKVLIG